MAARKQTAVDTVAGLEQQLAALKAQLTKARTAQAADAQKAIAGLVKEATKASAA
jgi:histone H1/5